MASARLAGFYDECDTEEAAEAADYDDGDEDGQPFMQRHFAALYARGNLMRL